MNGVSFQIRKLNAEKRLVTAWASVVTKADGTPIIDHQADVIDIDNLEDAFIEAFADGGISKGAEMHDRMGVADIVQHFTLSRDERLALGFGAGVEGAIVKVRVNDDALWQRVKSGELAELSIAGEGTREDFQS